MNEKRVEENILDLEDGWAYVRKEAVYALGRIGDASAVPALIGALEDENEYVRGGAAWALGEIGDTSAVPALIGLLGDGDKDVRGAAAYALGKIGLPAVPALINALGDGNNVVRAYAAYALGKIGDASAVPALVGALEDENTDVRLKAAEALGKIGPRDSADLRLIANAARKAKKEGRPVDNYWKVYSAWSKKLNERADALVLDKRFHVPKVRKPDKVERIMRVRRSCA